MPLTIEYRLIGQLPTCIGNERIRIAADGRVSHSRNTVGCEAGALWSAPWQVIGQLDAARMAQLAQEIVDSGVLALAPQSIAATVEGGKREELDVAIDEGEYHFVVQNTNVPAFRAVVARLWDVMFGLTG